MSLENNVVITGMGMVGPLGLTTQENWQAMLNGRSGVVSYDTGVPGIEVAAPVPKGFDPQSFMDRKEARRLSRSTHLAIASATEALVRAGIIFDGKMQRDNYSPERSGVMIGTGFGGVIGIADIRETILVGGGVGRVNPFAIPMAQPDGAVGELTRRFHFQGPSHAVVGACASGILVTIAGVRVIQSGEADTVLAVGMEAPLHKDVFAGFASQGALASSSYSPDSRKEENIIFQPHEVSRPFDRNAHGFVLGEGAGALVLESEEHAKARGASIYAYVIGRGQTADAYHLTKPSGIGEIRAMKVALQSAHLKPGEIDYVSTHGTGTPVGDPIEANGLHQVFGDATGIVFQATKANAGHLIGGAGMLPQIVVLEVIKTGMVPPTINLDNPIDGVTTLQGAPGLFFTPQTLLHKTDIALINSFGFGGINTSVIFSRGG